MSLLLASRSWTSAASRATLQVPAAARIAMHTMGAARRQQTQTQTQTARRRVGSSLRPSSFFANMSSAATPAAAAAAATPFSTSIGASPVALITGGSKGIGAAIAQRILQIGGKVFIADIDTVAGEALVSRIDGEFGKGRAVFFKCNVANENELAAAFSTCVKQLGGLNIAVNNAGVAEHLSIQDAETDGDHFPDDWTRTLNINLIACINGTRLAYKAMKANGAAGGVIINISSFLGLMPQGSNPLYAASKHGLVGFTRSLAHLAREGVRVNTLSPGYAETTLVTQGMGDLKMTPETMEVIQGIKDAGGMMDVGQVAEGAMILIEDNSLAGMALSVTPNLGYALHETPRFLGLDAPGQALGLPHRVIKKLIPKL